MSSIVFLAPVVDPTVPTTFYGKDHQTSVTDEAQIDRWQAEGKAARQGAAVRRALPTAIGTTTATISWNVDQACTSTRVEYGTTASYGTNVNGSPLTGGGAVSANLTGLTTATLYHYRIQVVVGAYTTYTADATFTTS